MAVAVDNVFGSLTRPQRCKLQSFTHLDFTLVDLSRTDLTYSSNQAFEIANFHRCLSTPCLSLMNGMEDDLDSNPRIEILSGSRDPRARALVVEVAVAMASGINAEPISSGLGGAYYLRGRNSHHNIAVAKPIDEEPLAFNNPKGFGGLMLGQPGLKRSVRVGETGMRELAAYLLDHDGFAGVSPTALVKITHVPFYVNEALPISPIPYKIASLQRFVDHDMDAGELGASSFSVGSVHRIGIFDVRLLNLDRHAGNLLVKKYMHDCCSAGSAELVPIDHGLCLPEWLDDPYFEWLHWPQASVPFSESELEYISSLDPFKDAELLRAELPSLSESSIRVLIVCTIFLKQAAASGLCLADIGEMMTRNFCGEEENWSALENLCLQAKSSMHCSFDDFESLGNDYSEKENDELTMIQFDVDTEDGLEDSDPPLSFLPESLDMARPFKIQKCSSISALPDGSFSPLSEENDLFGRGCDVKVIEDSDGRKGGLARSMSFPAQKHVNDSVGITFGDMSEEEWDLFLESFEKLVPQVIENSSCKGLKQRLGTSCEF